MKSNNILLVLAIALVVIALANFSITLIRVSDLKKQITGFASGFVNITVSTSISINISRDTINWGAGVVNTTGGFTNATLYTSQETSSVSRGNWSGDPNAIIIANDGNLNASISIQAGKSAATFFGAVGQQQYMWNVTSKDTGSCSGGATLGQWADVNTTSGGTKFCAQFDYADSRDEIYLDLLLTVPYNATTTGVLSDTLTITGNTAG